MKTNEEMAASVLARIQTEKSELNRKRKQYITLGSVALCLAAVAAVGGMMCSRPVQAAASVDKSFSKQAQNEELFALTDAEGNPLPAASDVPTAQGEAVDETAAAPASATKVTAEVTSAQSTAENAKADSGTVPADETVGEDEKKESSNADKSGGNVSKASVEGINPTLMNFCVKLQGEMLTPTEGADYIKKNAVSNASALRADPIIGPGELQFSTVGYRHLTYSEEEGLFVNTAFMDYPVFRNGQVIAVVTVYKDNGKVYGCPAYGGPGLAQLNKALDADPDSDVVFIYYGECPEAFITKDNTFYFNPVSIPVVKGNDYYSFFKGHGNEANKNEMSASAVTVK